jgi:hypothetical protein
MKKYAAFVFLFLLAVFAHGQDTHSVAFRNNVPVYSSPTFSADTLLTLNIGEGVMTTGSEFEDAPYYETVNGYSAQWHKVRVNETIEQGYVWVGDLSLTSIEFNSESDQATANGDTVSILFGIESFDNKGLFIGSLKVIVNHNLVHTKQFLLDRDPYAESSDTSEYYYAVGSHFADYVSLANVEHAFFINTFYPACGYPETDRLFVWTGNELVQGPDLVSVGDGGMFSSVDQFEFDETAHAGIQKITVHNHTEIFDEETTETVEERHERTDFLWDGSVFTKVRAEDQ